MPSASSRRLLTALAASLGVHGLVWLWVEAGAPEVRAPPPPATATLEWVEVEVATPPEPKPPPIAKAAPEPPPPAIAEAPRKSPPAPAEKPPPPAIAEAPPPPAVAENEPPPPPATEEPPPPPAVAEAPPTDMPRAAPADMPRAEAPRADLFPRDLPQADAPSGSGLLLAAREVSAQRNRGDIVVSVDAGVPDPGEPPAQEIVQDLVSESIGRGKVDRGLVHPYFGQLGKALVKVWDADRAVKEKGINGYFASSMERTRTYSKIWLERAESYGKSGAYGLQGTTQEDKRRPQSNVGDSGLQARREMRKKMREEFRATRRATIRVVQDRTGQLLDVQLVTPSNDPSVDREAMKDVRAAAEKLPAPPAEAVGNSQRISSLWQFELIISISPPIPTFTFEFDEALGFIDTRMPLDRRLYKRVRLLEVR